MKPDQINTIRTPIEREYGERLAVDEVTSRG